MGVASWSALARRRLVGQGGLIAAGRAATAGAAPHAPLVPPISARARWSSSRRLAIAAMFLALLLGAVLARCMLGLQGAPSYESSRTSFKSFSQKDDFFPSNLIDSYQSPQNVLDDAAQVLHIPTRRELPLRRCLRLQPLPPSCRSTWSSLRRPRSSCSSRGRGGVLSFTQCALMRSQCATLAHMLRDLPPHEAAHMPSIYLGEATSESIRAAEAILSNESSATGPSARRPIGGLRGGGGGGDEPRGSQSRLPHRGVAAIAR